MSEEIGTNENILKISGELYRSTRPPETKLYVTDDASQADNTGGLVFYRRNSKTVSVIDRVSVEKDDEGVWYLEFYADDIRYGVPITNNTLPILEMAQEEAQPRV